MTWRKREIIDMAREAGDATTDARGRETFVFDCYGLEAFAKLVREDEREVWAKFFDDNDTNLFWGSQAASHIRARDKHDNW